MVATMNHERVAEFDAIYRQELLIAVVKYPDEYPWYPHKPVQAVADSMMTAVTRGSFNKEGRAFKATWQATRDCSYLQSD